MLKSKTAVANEKVPICIGAGLVALDVVIKSDDTNSTRFYAGGTCGNVVTILSYLGWETYPIARLSNNVAAELLIQDLTKWNVRDSLLTFTEDGSTPIIIHRILKDKLGLPKHRFEFRNPEDGSYLPSYKPCLAKSVKSILAKASSPNIFFFDRINRSSIDLAKEYKSNGAVIYFEPSSAKDFSGFKKCLEIADIIKFSKDRIANFDELFPTGVATLEIQTLGEKGLKYRRKGASKWTPIRGYSIDTIVDSAGAGDWCTAGIIFKLFSGNKQLKKITDADLQDALNFGQVLGSLNCTFEGARGLMYSINNTDLTLLVQHIMSSEERKIPQRSNPIAKQHFIKQPMKISSLFAHH